MARLLFRSRLVLLTSTLFVYVFFLFPDNPVDEEADASCVPAQIARRPQRRDGTSEGELGLG